MYLVYCIARGWQSYVGNDALLGNRYMKAPPLKWAPPPELEECTSHEALLACFDAGQVYVEGW